MKLALQPQFLTSFDYWEPKRGSVIFVTDETHIDIVYQKLVEQDWYWEDEQNIIKVIPSDLVLNSYRDLDKYCTWVGKLDIYDVPKLVAELREIGIAIFIYQCQD